MNKLFGFVFSLVLIIIILVIGAYIWYNFFGWEEFSYKTDDKVTWLPTNGKNISFLRFKNSLFTVSAGDNTQSLDITPVLNGMAVGYAKGTTGISPSLDLDKPLNAFSFVIPGFNDRAVVSDPTIPPWPTATATLVGQVRTI